MRSLRIGIDLDGCVYDFVDALRRHLGRTIADAPDATRWDFFEDWGLTLEQFNDAVAEGVGWATIFGTGQPLPGAVDALRQLKEQGHSLHIVTDRFHGYRSQANTERWLYDYGIPYDSITYTRDKTIMRLDLAIEDNIKHYRALNDAGVLTYLLDRPWNRDETGTSRVHGWPTFVTFANIIARADTRVTTYPTHLDTTDADSILTEAHDLVHGDRGDDYGHPAQDFARTGRIWGALLGIDDVPPELVGLCMVGVKLSREIHKPKRDNLTDIAGYAETVAMCRQVAGE